MSRFRTQNNNWKGGRSLTSHGYVLLRVGVEHHLADVRGYAYEHRVLAERKLGRRLLPGEVVHHRDHNKRNNHPDNLEVTTVSRHRFHHRSIESNRKHPDEPNLWIECACGCGHTFLKFDNSNRPRRYVAGHNGRKTCRKLNGRNNPGIR